ncbi:MAG: hypothetical protein ACK5MY_09215 [Jhaorihella sp.]
MFFRLALLARAPFLGRRLVRIHQRHQISNIPATIRQTRFHRWHPGSGHHLLADAAWAPVSGSNHGLYTRKMPGRRISNTLEAECLGAALSEAIAECGPPEIMNTDRGLQFTSVPWTGRLRRSGVHTSMDGKGGSSKTSSSSDCGGA